LEAAEGLFEQVRRRAYELYEQRGRAAGWELDDWLQAERELLWLPLAELSEDEKEFRLQVAAPGMEAKDIQITAAPDWVLVQGETSRARFTPLQGRLLYHRFTLPVPVDAETMTAKLKQGIVEIRAAKAGVARPPRKTVRKRAAGA
jgi:HSP20 family molecular chaperone IbpA